MDYIIVMCPNCFNYIQILKKDFNCKIFRHGIFKDSNKQIDPHLSKKECDELIKNDKIYGCGKPFMLKEEIDEKGTINYFAIKCDYI